MVGVEVAYEVALLKVICISNFLPYQKIEISYQLI